MLTSAPKPAPPRQRTGAGPSRIPWTQHPAGGCRSGHGDLPVLAVSFCALSADQGKQTTTQATYLRTETIPLAQLQPFPGNAKRGDVGTILTSLCHNGQYRSLVVREVEPDRYVTLTGNHTTQAIAAHGPGDCGMTVKTGGEERPCGICGTRACPGPP
ncbi:hypothetical protein ACIOEW_28135 [Streptomyces sp. NPDC087901]|uniref:hypothetical protein n=1 Tax=Streptomyces sp. NPDC087901 TaxID=3365818 RepID=UPI0037FC7A29